MNEQLVAWLDALRSGKYKQTKGILVEPHMVESHMVDHYCCLGVLCDIMPEYSRKGFAFELANGDIFSNTLDINTLKSLGFKEWVSDLDLAGLDEDSTIIDLFVHLNDSLDYSFVEIAAFVVLNQDKLLRSETCCPTN